MYKIPLSVPSLKGNEWEYLKECLDTDWVSSAGKYVNLFEQKIAEYCGSKFSVACVNGTAALQVSLKLAGVNPGDEVIVPTLTFISSVNVILRLNFIPLTTFWSRRSFSRRFLSLLLLLSLNLI